MRSLEEWWALRLLNDPVAMAEKLFTVVGFRVDIEEVLHPDGRVVVFHIPGRPEVRRTPIKVLT